MNLKFQVNMQHIARMDHGYVVAGSRNFIECTFLFSEEWNGVVKTAVFRNGETVYHVILTEDAIACENMPVLSAGVWQISVFGGDLITADSAPLVVAESGYGEGTAPEAPSATIYETLCGMVSDAVAKTKSLEEKIGEIGSGTPVEITGETLMIN